MKNAKCKCKELVDFLEENGKDWISRAEGDRKNDLSG